MTFSGGQWYYHQNDNLRPFTPEPSDVLMASINYTNDTITSLAGTNTSENGIAKGYASGNLTYTADWWAGGANDGEFTVGEPAPAGSGYFIPHKLVAAKKYYYAGSQRVAMRSNGTLYWLFGDHLGSTSVVAAADGTKVSETRYKAWGEVRFTSSAAPTKYGYTGQYSYVSDFGLMFYNARWYDPALGRFTQADTIVPEMGNPAAFDRYAYVYNRPVTYTDPSGNSGSAPNGSQYLGQEIKYPVILDNSGNMVEPGTEGAQLLIHKNSCGPVCVAAVLGGLNANDIFDAAYNVAGIVNPEKGLDKFELAALIESINGQAPSHLPRWNAQIINIVNVSETAKKQLKHYLSMGFQPIALVNCNPGTGKLVPYGTEGAVLHWVVIIGITDDFSYVQIYNPFNDEIVDLTWQEFWDTWQYQDVVYYEYEVDDEGNPVIGEDGNQKRNPVLGLYRSVVLARRHAFVWRSDPPLRKCKDCPMMV